MDRINSRLFQIPPTFSYTIRETLIPGSCLGSIIGSLSATEDATACQAACQSWQGSDGQTCNFFSFYGDSHDPDLCELSVDCRIIDETDPKAVHGPKTCSPIPPDGMSERIIILKRAKSC